MADWLARALPLSGKDTYRFEQGIRWQEIRIVLIPSKGVEGGFSEVDIQKPAYTYR
jgi:hypothetical protein